MISFNPTSLGESKEIPNVFTVESFRYSIRKKTIKYKTGAHYHDRRETE